MHFGLKRSTTKNWASSLKISDTKRFEKGSKEHKRAEELKYIAGLTGLKPKHVSPPHKSGDISKKPQKNFRLGSTVTETLSIENLLPTNLRVISSGTITIGNILWLILFGWWMALFYFAAALLLLLSVVGAEYSRMCLGVASYILWPFGKYIVETGGEYEERDIPLTETSQLIPSLFAESTFTQKKDFGYYVWLVVCFVLLVPVTLFTTLITWFFVVSIPISKVNFRLLQLLVFQPSSISVRDSADRPDRILLYCIEAINLNYVSYNLLGVNIVLFNAVPLLTLRVILLIINMTTGHHLLNSVVAFVIDLVCTIPLTEFIGLSIESITLQTNYMVGALLNASFGSLTELILFSLAIKKGNLSDLILYSITGGLLNDTLLIPGLSMVAASIKFRTLKFNPKAAGVGSLLFYIALVGAFTPTLYYIAFNGYREECSGCYTSLDQNVTKFICEKCHYVAVAHDPEHDARVTKLMYMVMFMLPLTYIIGLVFTFKTHSDIFVEEHEEEDGEEAEWSIITAVIILSISVLCFGLIAEDMIENVEGFIHRFHISQAFLGVTMMCLTPAVTEIASAVRFALAGQISLSIQIGSSSAIQVALVQMPLVTAIAVIFGDPNEQFKLIFPILNVFSVMLAVFTLVFVSREGHTNYFIGSVLFVMYIILISAFYFIPETVTTNSTATDVHKRMYDL